VKNSHQKLEGRMRENENNLILLKEKRYRWTVYQFLIDEEGRKHIKMFSADGYWTEDAGIFVAEFTEDSLPEPSDRSWEGFQQEDIDFIKADFNNEENWKSKTNKKEAKWKRKIFGRKSL
jgi:hypothetical protein